MSVSIPMAALLHNPVTEALGWVLIHFLWQGFFVAALVWLVLVTLRRSSPQSRYVASCAGLLLMAALPIGTFLVLPQSRSPAVVTNTKVNQPPPIRDVTAENSSGVVPNTTGLNVPAEEETSGLHEAGSTATTVIDSNRSPDAARRIESMISICQRVLRPWLPSVTLFWSLGVVVLSIRLLLSWQQVRSLQTCGMQIANPDRVALLQQVATKLRVRQLVRLLESSLVEVPTVIGWFKPVILLPIASVTSLTTSQLEALLAHELAHVRRHDYAVNLIQSLIETLLFYHPAVWWISSQIRREREHCCDDLAASITNDKAGYVAALVRMEELRSLPRELALAACGSDLTARARRLLQHKNADRLSPWWLNGALGILVAASALGIPILITKPPVSVAADRPQTPANAVAAAAADQAPDNNAADDASLDTITPAQIADRIEAVWKQYPSIEYRATVEETRNTNFFQLKEDPILVKGTGSIHFRADADRWFADEKSFSFRIRTTETYPRNTTASFDGQIHTLFDGSKYVIGEEDLAHERLKPAALFWNSGLSAEWLLTALRRPEAKMTERIKLAETSCLHVQVTWTPTWDKANRKFDIMICPEQGWLPRRVLIDRGDELLGEWSIPQVKTTEQGLSYPAEIRVTRPDKSDTPFRKILITQFQERDHIEDRDFKVPVPDGAVIADYRRGVAWYDDPWWNELSEWLRDNIDWPRHNLQALLRLHSNSDDDIFGKPAPPLRPAEWIVNPIDGKWDRPDRRLTVLHFFGGQLIEPTPSSLKALDRLYQLYRDGGLEVIAIATATNTPELTRQAVKELNLSFPVAIDSKADAAELSAHPQGAQWGSTFAGFHQGIYSGTMLIDQDTHVVQIEPGSQSVNAEFSKVELLVREYLQKANGTPDPPGRRRMIVNRTSRLLRDRAAELAEIQSAIGDTSSQWRENAEQKIAASLTPAQKEQFKAMGMTIQATLAEQRRNPNQLARPSLNRIEKEWKLRASKMTGHSVMQGTIRRSDGVPMGADRAKAVLTPIFTLLNSDSLAARFVLSDHDRQQDIEADENGKFRIENLPLGTYQLTIRAPDCALTMRTVSLKNNNSILELDIVVSHGSSISGKVTDAAGTPIANAQVRPIERYESADNPHSYTTEHLPRWPATTGQNGEFIFESLFEGKYVFEITANGFKPTKTDQIPAGEINLNVVLNPAD